jgi:hypothetical protein
VLPSTYLFEGIQRMLARGEDAGDSVPAVVALLATTAAATLLSAQIFRWDKGEPLPGRAKVWIAVVFVPFLVLGVAGYLR